MGRYFVEYGALQVKTPNGPKRVIECITSSLDSVKISEEFARQIADALNAYGDCGGCSNSSVNCKNTADDSKTDKPVGADYFKRIVENLISCIEKPHDEFNRESKLNEVKGWLKSGEA